MVSQLSRKPLPSYFLNEGEKVKFGESELDIIFTPGHAPGHIVLHSKKYDFIIGGDVLFQMSIVEPICRVVILIR